jgi:hypothetical protein
METTDSTQERRRHHRRQAKIPTLLRMGIHLNGRGYSKDMSLNGICLVAPVIFQFIRPSQVNDHLGTHIKIMFPSHSLTVNGSIARLDHQKNEAGLHVISTTNDPAWEKLCRE